jgi:hypothetical protein
MSRRRVFRPMPADGVRVQRFRPRRNLCAAVSRSGRAMVESRVVSPALEQRRSRDRLRKPDGDLMSVAWTRATDFAPRRRAACFESAHAWCGPRPVITATRPALKVITGGRASLSSPKRTCRDEGPR